MYIKVTVPGQDAKTYRLSKAEVLIGSSSLCHIIISHPSISKKHARIIRDDAGWFATDQGSTNGTYYGDEQIVPGKRVELSVEQELRLGDQVFLELLEIAPESVELNEPQKEVLNPVTSTISSEQDKTRVISLADLQKAKETVVKQKQREKKKANIQAKKVKQKESQKFSRLILITGLLIFGGLAGSVWWRKNKDKFIKRETVVKKVATKFRSDDEIEKDIDEFRIRRTVLLPRNQIIDVFNNEKKCVQEEVLELCLSGRLTEVENGVVYVEPSRFLFFYDETQLLPATFATYLREPPIDEESARKLTFLSLLETDINPDKFETDTSIYIVFYRYDEMGKKRISYIHALPASSSTFLLAAFKELDLMNPETDIQKELKKLELYYTYY